MTPEQMRALANTTESVAEGLDHLADRVVLRRSANTLRAAADQLEAARRIAIEWGRQDAQRIVRIIDGASDD